MNLMIILALNVAEDIPETPKDEDLDGKKLLTTSDPLGDAMRWLKPLELFAKDRIDVWIVIYDVSVRRSEFAPPSDLSTKKTDFRRAFSSSTESTEPSAIFEFETSRRFCANHRLPSSR